MSTSSPPTANSTPKEQERSSSSSSTTKPKGSSASNGSSSNNSNKKITAASSLSPLEVYQSFSAQRGSRSLSRSSSRGKATALSTPTRRSTSGGGTCGTAVVPPSPPATVGLISPSSVASPPSIKQTRSQSSCRSTSPNRYQQREQQREQRRSKSSGRAVAASSSDPSGRRASSSGSSVSSANNRRREESITVIPDIYKSRSSGSGTSSTGGGNSNLNEAASISASVHERAMASLRSRSTGRAHSYHNQHSLPQSPSKSKDRRASQSGSSRSRSRQHASSRQRHSSSSASASAPLRERSNEEERRVGAPPPQDFIHLYPNPMRRQPSFDNSSHYSYTSHQHPDDDDPVHMATQIMEARKVREQHMNYYANGVSSSGGRSKSTEKGARHGDTHSPGNRSASSGRRRMLTSQGSQSSLMAAQGKNGSSSNRRRSNSVSSQHMQQHQASNGSYPTTARDATTGARRSRTPSASRGGAADAGRSRTPNNNTMVRGDTPEPLYGAMSSQSVDADNNDKKLQRVEANIRRLMQELDDLKFFTELDQVEPSTSASQRLSSRYDRPDRYVDDAGTGKPPSPNPHDISVALAAELQKEELDYLEPRLIGKMKRMDLELAAQKLQRRVDVLEDAFRSLESSITFYKQQQKSNEEQRTKFTKLEATLTSLRTTLQSQFQELTVGRHALTKEYEGKVTTLLAKYRQSQKDATALGNQVNSMQQELGELETSHASALEEAQLKLQKQVALYEEREAQVRSELEKVTDQYEETVEALSQEKIQSKQKIQAEVERRTKDLKEHHDVRHVEQKTQLAALQQELDHAQETIASLKRSNRDAGDLLEQRMEEATESFHAQSEAHARQMQDLEERLSEERKLRRDAEMNTSRSLEEEHARRLDVMVGEHSIQVHELEERLKVMQTQLTLQNDRHEAEMATKTSDFDVMLAKELDRNRRAVTSEYEAEIQLLQEKELKWRDKYEALQLERDDEWKEKETQQMLGYKNKIANLERALADRSNKLQQMQDRFRQQEERQRTVMAELETQHDAQLSSQEELVMSQRKLWKEKESKLRSELAQQTKELDHIQDSLSSSQFELEKELSSARRELSVARQQKVELQERHAVQSSTMQKEMQDLKQSHAEQLEKLQATHAESVGVLQSELTSVKAELEFAHSASQTARQEMDAFAALRAQLMKQQKAADNDKRKTTQLLEEIMVEHAAELEAQRATSEQREDRMAQLKKKLEMSQVAGKAQVETLKEQLAQTTKDLVDQRQANEALERRWKTRDEEAAAKVMLHHTQLSNFERDLENTRKELVHEKSVSKQRTVELEAMQMAHKETVKDLESRVSSLQETLTRTELANEEEVTQLQSKLKSATSSNAMEQQQEEIADLRSQLTMLKQALTQSEQSLTEKEELLSSQLEAERSKLLAVEEQSLSAQNDLEVVRDLLAQEQAKSQDLQAKYQRSKTRHEEHFRELTEKIEVLEKTLSTKEQEWEDNKEHRMMSSTALPSSQSDDHQKELSSLKQQLETITKQLEQSKEEQTEKESKFREYSVTITEMEEKLETKDKEIVELKEEINKVTAALQTSIDVSMSKTQDSRAFQEQINELEAELEKAKTAVAEKEETKEKDIEIDKAAAEESSARIKSLEDKLTEAETTQAETAKKMESLVSERADAIEALDSVIHEIQDRENELEALTTVLNTREDELEHAKMIATKAVAKAEELQASKDSRNEADDNADYEEMWKEIQRLEEEVKHTKAENSRLRDELLDHKMDAQSVMANSHATSVTGASTSDFFSTSSSRNLAVDKDGFLPLGVTGSTSNGHPQKSNRGKMDGFLKQSSSNGFDQDFFTHPSESTLSPSRSDYMHETMSTHTADLGKATGWFADFDDTSAFSSSSRNMQHDARSVPGTSSGNPLSDQQPSRRSEERNALRKYVRSRYQKHKEQRKSATSPTQASC